MAATMMRLIALTICLAAGSAFGQSVDAELVPPTQEEAADIAKWIDKNCCWTSGCCRKVRPEALRGSPGNRDSYQVVATGQTLLRTGWSRDGNTWRCACDQINGVWVVHLMANTRCIFPALSGS